METLLYFNFTCLGSICCCWAYMRHRLAYDACSQSPRILLGFCGQRIGKSIALLLSFACILQESILLAGPPGHAQQLFNLHFIVRRLTASPLSSIQNCRKCSYFQTPSSCASGGVRICSIFVGSLRICCWMYCWTANVLSISSNGSSGHLQKSCEHCIHWLCTEHC